VGKVSAFILIGRKTGRPVRILRIGYANRI